MKTISCLRDLEPFGIHPLTGEADALGFRCLCDVTEAGRKLMAETFGLKPDCCQDNWNNGGADNPHVGSVMLPNDAWKPLAIIALFTAGRCHTVITTERGCIFGLAGEEAYHHGEWEFPEDGEAREVKPAQITHDGYTHEWSDGLYGKIKWVFQFSNHPRQGTRNVHQFSGRAV